MIFGLPGVEHIEHKLPRRALLNVKRPDPLRKHLGDRGPAVCDGDGAFAGV